MNCWESVLISGILAGIYTREGVVTALSMKKGTQNNRRQLNTLGDLC